MRRNSGFVCPGLMVWLLAGPAPVAGDDWPVLGHDAARSGATGDELRPPLARKWYRLFPDEGIMAGVQPVVAEGKVLVGTLAGRLHALDAATGRELWVHKAIDPVLEDGVMIGIGTEAADDQWFRGPRPAILHASAVSHGMAFFGTTRGFHAVALADGKPRWTYPTPAGVWNAPVVHQETVLFGTRAGTLVALDLEGKPRWVAGTGGPVLSSPAVDPRAGRVYVGSEDMHVYAFDLADGRQLWKSPKLPGASLRGYHPVVAPDGAVMVTAMPTIALDTINAMLLDMVREVFGDFASWRHGKEENDRLRAANFKLMEDPATYGRQLAYLTRRLAEQPACQTFFVLDPADGRPRFVAPIVYAESMNGPGAPPLVTPAGRVIVKYQALLRSRYEHYSPFLNVGYLDTSTGRIEPLMDPSRTYGWHDSLLLVHDEQSQLSLAGRVLINTHQDNVNALDLETLAGYDQPWARGIHEPQPGEAVGIWAQLLRDEKLPAGKEWLARGTAVYGGGSVIDVPVSVAGDSFYYLPTHELNAGAAVIAYRMDPQGQSHTPAPPPQATLSEAEWQRIQGMPWDWDVLGTARLDHVLRALPGPVPGTRPAPLWDEARRQVAAIADDELDRYVWDTSPTCQVVWGTLPTCQVEGSVATDPARGARWQRAPRAELVRAVEELIGQTWRPLVFPAGKHPMEGYRFFVEPTQTLETLARAFPHLPADVQANVRRHVADLRRPGGPLDGPTGAKTFPPEEGAIRSLYDPPPADWIHVRDDITRTPLARLYPLWLWASQTGDWGHIERFWPQLRALVDEPPNPPEEDCHNGRVAGLIAYCRIARHTGDEVAVARGLAAARQAMRERLEYELAHPRGGVSTQVPEGRTIFGRWRHLTPELGRLLAAYAGPIERELMSVYVDRHRPAWFLAWGPETMVRNESPLALPTMPAEIFAARALILGEPAGKLAGYVDLPWCRGDLFYIDKLATCQ